jgi:cation-transporting ATPase F
VVVAIGADTELGLMHRLLSDASELATPLTRKLAHFSRILTIVILALAGVTFAVGVVRGEVASEMLVAAVALAVGAIPGALPAAVTVSLAIGVSRMAQRNAIVRRLPAVETLGSTTVICTDKTGTLTQNAMTVQSVLAGGELYSISGGGYGPDGNVVSSGHTVSLDDHPALAECLRAGVLCGDGDVRTRDEVWEPVGDPMEAALVVAARKAGLDRSTELRERPRTDVLPFESERRYMATVHRGAGGDARLYVKGAAEHVLSMCERTLGGDGRVRSLDRRPVLAAAEELGRQGQRVVALATARLARDAVGALGDPEALTFVGLQALADPPRPEALTAVRACRQAGIAVKMITGDHAATAGAIAARVGLASDTAPAVVTGAELAQCPDEQLGAMVDSADVFARVSAEQKLRLVKALQSRGDVVAMTGDGVNDAPALHHADIGVAMGRIGTEVAREAADIVLADDNFATIEAAVEEGRHTFDNIKKFIAWTLPTNLGEGLLVLTAIAVGATLPILPVQILWINMTTAVLLGLTLAFEQVEPGIMTRPPRRPSEPLMSADVIARIFLVSFLLLTVAFALFEHELGRGRTTAEARTIAANVFVFVEIAYVFNCRSFTGRAIDLGLFSNRWLLGGVSLTIALQLLFTYWSPMNDLFGTAPIDALTWLEIIAVAAVAWIVVEVEKTIRRRRARRGTRTGAPPGRCSTRPEHPSRDLRPGALKVRLCCEDGQSRRCTRRADARQPGVRARGSSSLGAVIRLRCDGAQLREEVA